MLLPLRSKNPPESLPIVTLSLIVANVAIFFATSNGFMIKREVALTWGLKASNASPWTVLSSTFLHGSILHLLGNMWFLYILGFAVEGRLRAWRFTLVYVLAGIAGGLLHMFIAGRMAPDVPVIGASGAIMGVLGASLWLFPFSQVTFLLGFSFYWRLVDLPMWGVALMYLGLDFVFALLTTSAGGGGVAHLAHLGGAAGGLLACALLRPRRDTAAASAAKAMLADTKDLGVLSSAELAAMARTNPDDTTLVLNWMHRSQRDPRGASPECQAAFLRLLPRMLREEPAGPVGFCLANLAAYPGIVPLAALMDSAARLERGGDPSLALRLYECVLRDPRSRPADQEAALFRRGLLYETAFGNRQYAEATYEEIARRFPMSPFADQARARLTALRRHR